MLCVPNALFLKSFQESEEMCGHHVDPLSVDPWPVVSVDRNKISKQLLFTTDAASLKSVSI